MKADRDQDRKITARRSVLRCKMKRKTAKELLAESFRELAENRNIDRITVQAIVDNCGYSPATFYRNFSDKYDLIAWDYTQRLSRIMNRIDGREYSWKQTLLDGALFFEKEKQYLANLFLHTSGQESFVRYMTEINHQALKKTILAFIGKKGLDEMTEMYVRIYCLGTVNLTCEWILGKYKAAPDQLAEIYANALPVPLQQYLLQK